MEITNPYIVNRLEEIKTELIEKNHIKPINPLTEEEQLFGHLIAVYEATKHIIG